MRCPETRETTANHAKAKELRRRRTRSNNMRTNDRRTVVDPRPIEKNAATNGEDQPSWNNKQQLLLPRKRTTTTTTLLQLWKRASSHRRRSQRHSQEIIPTMRLVRSNQYDRIRFFFFFRGRKAFSVKRKTHTSPCRTSLCCY